MSHDPEPPRGRRRRGLTEDERTLWETVARQVKPLRKIQRPVRPHPPMVTA
ncbi:MAG: DNA mismatch repair protein MutS, partial [Bradyrhizobium sp.]|nr:DNA mismatch repair protein MutS [Bradyrhizobium sp.]